MRFVLALAFCLFPFADVAQGQIPIPQTPQEARLDDQTCRQAGFARRTHEYRRCRTRLAKRRDRIKRPEVLKGLCIFNGWPGTAHHRCCRSQRDGRRDVGACEAFAEELRKQEECRQAKKRAEEMRKNGFVAFDPMC